MMARNTSSVRFVLATLVSASLSTSMLSACSDTDAMDGGSAKHEGGGGNHKGGDGQGNGPNGGNGGANDGGNSGGSSGGSVGGNAGGGGGFVEEVTDPSGNSVLIEVRTASGTIVSGATVKLVAVGGGTVTATTGQSGGALFESLAAGDYVAWLSGSAWMTTSQTLAVDAGEQSSTVLLAVPRSAAVPFDTASTLSLEKSSTGSGLTSEVSLVILPGVSPSELEVDLTAVDPATATALWGTRAVDGAEDTVIELGPAFSASVVDASTGDEVQPGDAYTAHAALSDAGTMSLSDSDADEYKLYRFDVDQGAWQETDATLAADEGFPTAGEWSGELDHFSSWAMGKTASTACVNVTVTDLGGSPQAGVSVVATGVGYNGKFGPVKTNSSGQACVGVKAGAQASVFVISEPSTAQTVTAGASAAACGGGEPCTNVSLELNRECTPGASATCQTEEAGACAAGSKSCAASYAWGACVATAAVSEVCGNQVDDDCDGEVDEGCDSCVPATEDCATEADEDCDGEEDGQSGADSECVCEAGETASCYGGAEGTAGLGICASGTTTCAADGKSWQGCVGATFPTTEVCEDGKDNDCDDVEDDGCACESGYAGSIPSCSDINECELGTDDCASGYDCENTAGSFSCNDIDECAEGIDVCGDFYSCENTEGNYACNDIDECELGTHDCEGLATCANFQGGFLCDCPQGYDATGTSCADIDECDTGNNNCSDAYSCVNSEGSYSCEDVDECANETDNCDVNATCENNEGSFSCTCNEGYAGDGTSCAVVAPPEDCRTVEVDEDGDEQEQVWSHWSGMTLAASRDDSCTCYPSSQWGYTDNYMENPGSNPIQRSLTVTVTDAVSAVDPACAAGYTSIGAYAFLVEEGWTAKLRSVGYVNASQNPGALSVSRFTDETCGNVDTLACHAIADVSVVYPEEWTTNIELTPGYYLVQGYATESTTINLEFRVN